MKPALVSPEPSPAPAPKRRARKPHVLGRVVVVMPGTRALLRMAQVEGRTVVATYDGGVLTLTMERI